MQSESKKKNIKYSLSFGEDDVDEDNESGFISKIDSKQVSMYDIDEELKELKEIRNNLRSPAPNSFLKKNTKDYKFYNFNIANNSIFGENFDESNISSNLNTTRLAEINEKYDILTQLKKLNEEKNTTPNKSHMGEENDKNQFNKDSFGNKKDENDINPIVFVDKLELSFHDEVTIPKKKSSNQYNDKSNLNMIIFLHDKKVIKKLNFSNENKEYMTNISYIDSRMKTLYCYNFVNDINFVHKLNIDNLFDNLNINHIEIKRLKKGIKEDKTSLINPLMNNDNNMANLLQNKDSCSDTICTIEDIDNIEEGHEDELHENNKINNKTENNTKKILAKNDKNNSNNKLDWTQLTNNIKKENNKSGKNLSSFCEMNEKPGIIKRNQNKNSLFSLNNHKKNVKFKTTKKNQNTSEIYEEEINFTVDNKNNNFNNLNLSIKKNIGKSSGSLRKNMNLTSSLKNPLTHKKVNSAFNTKKMQNSNLVNNDFENPNKINKTNDKQKVLNKDKNILKNNKKFVSTFENKKVKDNNNYIEKKPKTNYSNQYHKRINSNINNSNNYSNKKEAELNQNKCKHNRNKSDIINYDYVFSVYNDLCNNPAKKTFHNKNQSTGKYQTNREEENL
jgi:hypothetical protein